jgi:hypothetical protein
MKGRLPGGSRLPVVDQAQGDSHGKKKATVTQIGLEVHREFSLASGRDGATQRIILRQRLKHADREQLRERLLHWPQGVPVILEATFGWGWMSDLAASQTERSVPSYSIPRGQGGTSD